MAIRVVSILVVSGRDRRPGLAGGFTSSVHQDMRVQQPQLKIVFKGLQNTQFVYYQMLYSNKLSYFLAFQCIYQLDLANSVLQTLLYVSINNEIILQHSKQETPQCDETRFSTLQPSIDKTGIKNERWQ